MATLRQTVDALRGRIATVPGSELPSLRFLAGQLGVSRLTMLRAARILRDEGLLQFRQGSRPWVPGKTVPRKPETKLLAWERVREALRKELQSGGIRAGDTLPKSQFLSAMLGASHHTIAKALRALCEEKLLTRSGRSYRAGGTQPESKGERGYEFRLTILALVSSPYSWHEECVNPRTGEFGRAFVSELNRVGIDLQVCVRNPVRNSSVLPTLGGADAIDRHIHALCDRYAGCLIAANRTQIPDIDWWIEFFMRQGRPVVWFDKNDEGLARQLHSRFFTRCHVDHRAGVVEAVRILQAHGHRLVHYADPDPAPWSHDRLRLLQEVGRQMEPPLAVQESFPFSLGRNDGSIPDILALVEDMYRSGTKGMRSRFERINRFMGITNASIKDLPGRLSNGVRGFASVLLGDHREKEPDLSVTFHDAQMLRCCLAIWPCFREPAPTAAVFPNDATANTIMKFLADIGMKTDSAFSVLSFDNTQRYSPYTQTTIDWGFDQLGYWAFHAILGDIPLPRNTRGHIATKPRVVWKRGTVMKV